MKFIKNRIRIQRDAEIAEELISDSFSNAPHSIIHKNRVKDIENRRKKLKLADIERK